MRITKTSKLAGEKSNSYLQIHELWSLCTLEYNISDAHEAIEKRVRFVFWEVKKRKGI